jgi:hypothetical protein
VASDKFYLCLFLIIEKFVILFLYWSFILIYDRFFIHPWCFAGLPLICNADHVRHLEMILHCMFPLASMKIMLQETRYKI